MTAPPSSHSEPAVHRHGSTHLVLSLVAALFISTACQSSPNLERLPFEVVPDIEADGEGLSEQRHDIATPAASTLQATRPLQTWQPTWLALIDESFIQARSLVEKQLDLDLSDIRLQLVDDKSINHEVALETRRLINEQFGATAFAKHFLEQVMHPLAGTYAALYSSRLKSVMISRSMLSSYERSLSVENQNSGHAALLTLLIHELVHAADDKRYHIHDNRALNFRASFAQSATFEGHAQWVTRQICEKTGCLSGLVALDEFMFSTGDNNDQLTQPVEAISRNVLEYSYIEGERFVSDLARRANGKQLIDDLLSNPPLDPIQILAPGTYPDVAREQRNQQLFRASRNVQHPWTAQPFIGIETSPLKGIDLRSDPDRRQAAIDGFTRLIQGMVSIQFYDQEAQGILPLEATVLQAESPNTAHLFATILHKNTSQPGAVFNDESLTFSNLRQDQKSPLSVHIYRTAIDDASDNYRTAIALSGSHVVQISGNTTDEDLLDDYAVRVLLNLQHPDADS